MPPLDILVFDDNEAVAEALGWMLGASLAKVQVVTRVGDALARLDTTTLDFALIDYWAPEGGGGKVATAAIERMVPFSFITGDPLAAEVMDDVGLPVLRKPCRTAQLVARARAEVQRSREQRATASALGLQVAERRWRLHELQVRLLTSMEERGWRP
jgi:DNA-binding response OmpR family regulator